MSFLLLIMVNCFALLIDNILLNIILSLFDLKLVIYNLALSVDCVNNQL